MLTQFPIEDGKVKGGCSNLPGASGPRSNSGAQVSFNLRLHPFLGLGSIGFIETRLQLQPCP